MIVRTTRAICDLLAAAVLGVLLLVSIAGWRLAQGPVPLDFLTPHFVTALNGQGSPFRVAIDRTELAWAGWERTLDIRVIGVRALAKDDQLVANVPEMSVGLSVIGLLRGIVAPTGIDVIGPTLRLAREKSGAFTMALGGIEDSSENANSEVINRLILAIQSAPDPDHPVTYLKRINFLDARLTIDDRMVGVSWGAKHADIVLLKEGGALRGNFDAALDIGGTNTELKGSVRWRPNSDLVQIESEFSGVKMDRLSAKLPKLKIFDVMHFDMQGRAALAVSTSGVVKNASFDLKAGKGQLAFTQLWPKGLPIGAAHLSGSFDGKTNKIEITQFGADIGGPIISGHATVEKLSEEMTLNLGVSVDKMTLTDLPKYWPTKIGVKARSWVVKNMRAGNIRGTNATLSFRITPQKAPQVSLDAMLGTLNLKDTTIHHLAGLPPVKNVAASIVFTRDQFIAKIRQGTSANLKVTAAQVRLTDLQSDNEQADIDVSVKGALSDALVLIDRPPLGFASRFGLQADAVSGDVDTQLNFKFPLLSDLPLDKVKIQTTSRLDNPEVPNLAFGQTVSAKTLDLKVDGDRMELAGRARIGEVEAAIKWTELFGDGERYPRRYEAKAVLSQAQRDALGLVQLSPYLEGPLKIDLAVLQPREGPKNIALKVALKDAELWLPGFQWRKPVGREAIAWLRLLVEADGKLSVPEFSLGSPDLVTNGSIEFDRDQKFTELKIKKFTFERTDFSGHVRVTSDGKYDVKIDGTTLDAARFLEPDDIGMPEEKADDDTPALPGVNLQVNFDRVWFDDKIPVDRLTGELQWDEEKWKKVNLSGLVGNDQKVTFTYAADPGSKKMVIRSNNAGNALRALDTIDNIQGGTMTLEAYRIGQDLNIPWKGRLVVSDFVLVKAPLLAKILTIASLTGIGDTLAGKGIRFAKLESPFEFRNGVATIRNARTVGAQLGFTAEGSINTKTDTIQLSGTIIPAYTLNSVLGKIPILGRILTGKKGSGIFAATYRVEGGLEKPKVSVNPLAALAPGFLRNLVGVFDGSVKPDANQAPIAPELD